MTHEVALAILRAQPAPGIDASMVRRSLVVAIIVGTILNLISCYDLLLAGELPDPLKAILTYVVPFIVATYSALEAKRQTARELKALCMSFALAGADDGIGTSCANMEIAGEPRV
ncbi:MAG: hypothetical protein NUV50_05160 [Rhodospirillales bacterium]|nr:hypothetical protein [Rhodospirillales bacterium]